MSTAYSLAKSGLDPVTTRWYAERAEAVISKENNREEDSSLENVIDVEAVKSGSVKDDEVKKFIGEAYAKDPMLGDDDE